MKADKQTIASLIAYLKRLPDGTEISTCQLIDAAGCSVDNDFTVLMNIQYALFEAAEKENIILDLSKHDGKVEGLPYVLDFKVIKKHM